jgi:hypothetical protein
VNFDLADLEIINDQTAIVIPAEYDKGSALLITNNQVESWRLLYRPLTKESFSIASPLFKVFDGQPC